MGACLVTQFKLKASEEHLWEMLHCVGEAAVRLPEHLAMIHLRWNIICQFQTHNESIISRYIPT